MLTKPRNLLLGCDINFAFRQNLAPKCDNEIYAPLRLRHKSYYFTITRYVTRYYILPTYAALNIINLRKIMLSYLDILLAFQQKVAENTENQQIQKISTYGSALLQGVGSNKNCPQNPFGRNPKSLMVQLVKSTQWPNFVGLANMAPLGGKKVPTRGTPGTGSK